MSADLLELGITYRPQGPAEQRVRCPRCDRSERDDALGVNVETGVYHCFRCGWSGKAATGETRRASVHRLDDPERAERIRRKLREVWKASVPLTEKSAKPVRSYLSARGLAAAVPLLDSRVVRAHRGLEYWDAAARRKVGSFPAMVAIVSGVDGKPRAIHATYLRHDGCAKANVASPKKTLQVPVRGATKGGAIRLVMPRQGVLGIAEGIENALSLLLLRKVPAWSARCAENLRDVQLPQDLRELLIGVDLDENGVGQRAAHALADRMKRERPHIKVTLITPSSGAGDLNDELRGRRP